MRLLPLLLAVALALTGCWSIRSSDGGGEIAARGGGGRWIAPEDIALLHGFTIEVVATGLRFPTGVAFDEAGTPYVTESGYSYGEVFSTPRLVRIDQGGLIRPVAAGSNGPWNGVVFHQGAFYVTEGGQEKGGRVVRIGKDGTITPLVENLPSLGDHHTNGPAIGPDGKIYFGQGTATNSGVVGEDNHQFGWLKRRPEFHDVPCRDVTLMGLNFRSKNVLTPDQDDEIETGAYMPFGKTSTAGQIIRGKVPCTGAILRTGLEGGPIEVVAWGLRNPYGLAFSPEGRLFVTENGMDNRGSRPAFGSADVLWEIKEGTWYGWPDYSEGRALGKFHKGPGKEAPSAVIREPPNIPPKPTQYFASHSSSNGLDFSRSEKFGFVGQVFVAQLGDQAPITNKVFGPVGFKVVKIDLPQNVETDFATNYGETNGPASKLGSGGFERPIAVRFDPSGESLYVVDFGVLAMDEFGSHPKEGTGVLWRIRRKVVGR